MSSFSNRRTGKSEMRYVLFFEEAPGLEKWLGKHELQAMIDHYGDETDEWHGKRVPLVKAQSRIGASMFVQIANGEPPLDWAGVLKKCRKL